jgi:hypothetical protein
MQRPQRQLVHRLESDDPGAAARRVAPRRTAVLLRRPVATVFQALEPQLPGHGARLGHATELLGALDALLANSRGAGSMQRTS